MEIAKFKLVDNGGSGVEVWGKEYLRSNVNKRMLVKDDVHRKRRTPVNADILQKIDRLKYYFLNITGHWVKPYNNYFDTKKMLPVDVSAKEEPAPTLSYLKNLYNRTSITGVSTTDTGFVITGTFDIVQGKLMGVATPLITEDDDLGFFADARDEISKIVVMLEKFIAVPELTLAEAKELLMLSGISKESVEVKTEDEVIRDACDLLVSKDFLVIEPEETSKMIEEKKDGKTKLSTSTKNIDGANLKVAKEDKKKVNSPKRPEPAVSVLETSPPNLIDRNNIDPVEIDPPPMSDLARMEYSSNIPPSAGDEQQSDESESWEKDM